MKTFLLVLLLGGILYLLYRHAQDFGYPWEDQVTLTQYDSISRYRSGGGQVYVHGEVQNRTQRRLHVEVECVVLPAGMTLTPKGMTAVTLEAQEKAPFEVALTARREVQSTACEIGTWQVDGGMDDALASMLWRAVGQVRRWF